MQIPKFLSIICAAALGATTLNAQRADTDEQIKARELLRQKMAELDAKQPATQSQPPAPLSPEPAKPPQKPKAKKAATKPAPVFAPVPNQQFPTREFSGAPPLTPPAKPATETAPPPAAVPPAVTPRPAVKAPAPSAPVAAPAPARTVVRASAPVVSTARLSAEDEARVRAALHEHMGAAGSAATTSDTLFQSGGRTSTTKARQPRMEDHVFSSPASLQSPIPSSISSSKQQSLAELLSLYRANAITPDEYHKRRAQILSQP